MVDFPEPDSPRAMMVCVWVGALCWEWEEEDKEFGFELWLKVSGKGETNEDKVFRLQNNATRFHTRGKHQRTESETQP